MKYLLQIYPDPAELEGLSADEREAIVGEYLALEQSPAVHHLDFEVARAEALSAFYHPFAYATSRLAEPR